MKTTELTASSRDSVGKRSTKSLRNDGQVPGVIYANGSTKHIFVDAKAVKPAVYTAETFIVKVALDGVVHDTIVRKADFHPVTEKMTHIELLQVTADKPVTITLPLRMSGVPAGVIKGGKLAVKLRKITVKGIASELPDSIDVPVGHMDLGQTIKVGDVDFGGLQILTSPSVGIASVEIPRALRSASAGKK